MLERFHIRTNPKAQIQKHKSKTKFINKPVQSTCMADTKQKILITSALPYANGQIHLGHMVEYIQTDVLARFLRAKGNDIIYVCADDTHGTQIEINARKKGISHEQLIAKYYREHISDFADFHVKFDSYYTTNSPENRKFSDFIFAKLKERGY